MKQIFEDRSDVVMSLQADELMVFVLAPTKSTMKLLEVFYIVFGFLFLLSSLIGT